MTLNYKVTGKDRKALAEAISSICGAKLSYTGAPSFAYTVGDFCVDKNGTVFGPDDEVLVRELEKCGFTLEASPDDTHEEEEAEMAFSSPDSGLLNEEAPVIVPEEKEPETEASAHQTSEEEDNTFIVSISRDTFPDDCLARLKQIIESKAPLFQRALKRDSLPIEASENEISFPWFTLSGIDGETLAYSQFIVSLCKMAKELKRVVVRPYDGDNDRFAMRIFMVRLNMKGPEFALCRKLMLKNLSGNSGWRYGAPPKKEPATKVEPATEPEAEAEPVGQGEE